MVGILASLPKVAMQQVSNLFSDDPNLATNPFSFIISFIVLIGIIVFVVLMSTAVRKIPVSYAKRIVGRKMYGGQATHLPLKILTAGVMPIIFLHKHLLLFQLV